MLMAINSPCVAGFRIWASLSPWSTDRNPHSWGGEETISCGRPRKGTCSQGEGECSCSVRGKYVANIWSIVLSEIRKLFQ